MNLENEEVNINKRGKILTCNEDQLTNEGVYCCCNVERSWLVQGLSAICDAIIRRHMISPTFFT